MNSDCTTIRRCEQSSKCGRTPLRRDGGCIPFASPGLLQAAPPTHKQAENLSFKGTSSLPVLPSPESTQRRRGWALSDLGGCKRYNTLDLASKIVCQRWAATPLWKLPAGIDRPPLGSGGIRSTPGQQGALARIGNPESRSSARPLKPWFCAYGSPNQKERFADPQAEKEKGRSLP